MRYWAYLKGEVPGSFAAEELAAAPDFSLTTLVCPAEGEILEKNWRRAGEFEELAKALASREASSPPPAPPPAGPAASAPGELDKLLDGASTRLFSHVADLMKELENRREEKALVLSLQRQVSALRDELAQARERASMAEVRLPRIPELEEALRKAQAEVEQLRAGLAGRDEQVNEQRMTLERTRVELEAVKRRLSETAADLAMRNRLVDKLSKDLSEKELALAKSLGVIRRLEEDLDRLCPRPDAAPAAAAEAPSPLPSVTAPAVSADEPPAAPSYLEPAPPEETGAHAALARFLKKVFPGPSH